MLTIHKEQNKNQYEQLRNENLLLIIDNGTLIDLQSFSAFLKEIQNQFRSGTEELFVQGLAELSQLELLTIVIEEDNPYLSNLYFGLGQIIKRNQNLTFLSIQIGDDNLIDAIKIQQLINGIYTIKGLIRFSFSVGINQIGDDGIKCLSENISLLENLLQLKIIIGNNNLISRKGFQTLGIGLKKLINLESLIVEIGESNELGSTEVKYLIENISSIIKLQQLTFIVRFQNKIQQEGGLYLGQNLSKLVNLTHLSLILPKMNDISTEGIASICQGISKLGSLTNLSLSLKQTFNEEILNYLGLAFNILINLQILQIQATVIIFENEEDCTQFIIGFSNLKNLIRFSIQVNQLNSTRFINNIRDGMRELKYIKDIVIRIKQTFKMNFFKEISKIIETKPNIQSLHLQFQLFCQMQIQDVIRFIQVLSNLSNLTYLKLQNLKLFSKSQKKIVIRKNKRLVYFLS